MTVVLQHFERFKAQGMFQNLKSADVRIAGCPAVPNPEMHAVFHLMMVHVIFVGKTPLAFGHNGLTSCRLEGRFSLCDIVSGLPKTVFHLLLTPARGVVTSRCLCLCFRSFECCRHLRSTSVTCTRSQAQIWTLSFALTQIWKASKPYICRVIGASAP